MVRIRLVSNEGAGFADTVEVADNTTIGELFAQRMPGQDASRFNIRVNGDNVQRNEVLCNGDRVTITPNKIAGA
jgi:sulfur carrier protein ThiS